MSDLTPAKTEEVTKADASGYKFRTDCEKATKNGGEVVIAIREFPSAKYRFLYDRNAISIEQARLERLGFASFINTEMDSKCSKLILVIEARTLTQREVHAERLQVNGDSVPNDQKTEEPVSDEDRERQNK